MSFRSGHSTIAGLSKEFFLELCTIGEIGH
jgi:hypothetical protein